MNHGADFACNLYSSGLEYAKFLAARHGDCILWDVARLLLWKNRSLRVLGVVNYSLWSASEVAEIKRILRRRSYEIKSAVGAGGRDALALGCGRLFVF